MFNFCDFQTNRVHRSFFSFFCSNRYCRTISVTDEAGGKYGWKDFYYKLSEYLVITGELSIEQEHLPKLFADMSGVFLYKQCTSSLPLFQRNTNKQTIVCLLVLRWKIGRELVHCLYKKLQTCLPTSRRPAKPYLFADNQQSYKMFIFIMPNYRSLTPDLLSLVPPYPPTPFSSWCLLLSFIRLRNCNRRLPPDSHREFWCCRRTDTKCCNFREWCRPRLQAG